MRICFIVFCVLFAACKTTPDESTTANDPGTDQHMYLVPVDSIGVLMGDSGYVFGNIYNSRRDISGNIVILDTGTNEIRIFSPAGEALERYNLEGEGPGQFFRPNRLCCLDDGGFLISSHYDRKVCRFDLEMNLVFELLNTSSNLSGPNRVYALPDSAFVVRWSVLSQDADSIGSQVSIHSNSLENPDVIIRRRMRPFDPDDLWGGTETLMVVGVAPSGEILLVNYSIDTWQIDIYSSNGEFLNTVEREYEPVLKSDEQVQEELEVVKARYVAAYGSEAGFDYEPEPYIQVIKTIQVDDQNRMWVYADNWDETVFEVMTMEGDHLFWCTAISPDWQDFNSWSVRVNRGDNLASPTNPDQYPLLYMLELVPDSAYAPNH